jgi:hypothetical protein
MFQIQALRNIHTFTENQQMHTVKYVLTYINIRLLFCLLFFTTIMLLHKNTNKIKQLPKLQN